MGQIYMWGARGGGNESKKKVRFQTYEVFKRGSVRASVRLAPRSGGIIAGSRGGGMLLLAWGQLPYAAYAA